VIVLGSRIDESYFETLGVPLTSGRGIRAGDGLEAPPVAVVNESFATRYWPGQSAVGKRLRLSSAADRWVEIVGVTTTGKVAWLAERPQEFIYLPSAQYPSALERRSRMVLLVKTAGDPAALAAPLREVVRGIDANQPVFDVRTMKSRFEMAAVNPNLIIIQLIGAMGALGVFLSLTGLYGLVAYQVSTRTREFGLRMALGAQRKDVLALVLRPGVFLAAVGTAGGALLSVTADRLMAAAFPGNKHSILAYLIVVPGIFLVTLLAAYIPARRAAVADPASTLRNP
jgi:hypothetical protein